MRYKAGLFVIALAIVAAPTAFGSPARDTALPLKVTVSMTEFKFSFLPRTAKKGTVAFAVVNKGKVAHDFKIKGKKTPQIAAGKRGSLRVTFTRAGRYPYLCTVPGHAAAGMKGVLVVK